MEDGPWLEFYDEESFGPNALLPNATPQGDEVPFPRADSPYGLNFGTNFADSNYPTSFYGITDVPYQQISTPYPPVFAVSQAANAAPATVAATTFPVARGNVGGPAAPGGGGYPSSRGFSAESINLKRSNTAGFQDATRPFQQPPSHSGLPGYGRDVSPLVSPEMIEAQVLKCLSQLNQCLAHLHAFSQQTQSPKPVRLSSHLLQAAELHVARRNMVSWISKFNREISAGFEISLLPPVPYVVPPRVDYPGAQQQLQLAPRAAATPFATELQSTITTHTPQSGVPTTPQIHGTGPTPMSFQPQANMRRSSVVTSGTPVSHGSLSSPSSSHGFDQDPLGPHSMPSDEDPDESPISPLMHQHTNSGPSSAAVATAPAAPAGIMPFGANIAALKMKQYNMSPAAAAVVMPMQTMVGNQPLYLPDSVNSNMPSASQSPSTMAVPHPPPQPSRADHEVADAGIKEEEKNDDKEDDDHEKRGGKKRPAQSQHVAGALRPFNPKRRPTALMEKVSKGAASIMQFKITPSKSTPLQPAPPPPGFVPASRAKVPAALAKTAARSMIYSFMLRKPPKQDPEVAAASASAPAPASASDSTSAEPARKPSLIGTALPDGVVSLDDFDQLGILGTGTFGKVRLCVHRATRQYFCLKILRKQTIYRYHQINHVQNEKYVLRQVNHPGIVRLFSSFNDQSHLYFLLEYVPGGELFTMIRKFGKLPEDWAKFYAAEIVVILEYLHSRNIIYRDLKPENILLEERGHVKLADFGFAKQIADRTWTMCGTPDYMAPELIAMTGHGAAVDYWSLGVLVFEMLVGYPPFTDSSTMGLFAKIREPERLELPSHLSPEAKSFIQNLLVVDPTRRLGAIHREISNIRQHPWFGRLDWEAIEARSISGPIIPQMRSAGDTANFEAQNTEGGVDRLPPQPDVVLPPEIQRLFDEF